MFNPLKYFRSFRSGGSGSLSLAPLAHMTWASVSISRGVSRTGVFLRNQVWVWPIIATVLLSFLAFGVRRAIESTMKENLRSQLQALLDVDTAMLENWFKMQSTTATTLANDVSVRETIYEILAAHEAQLADPQALPLPDLQKQLQKRLSPTMSAHAFAGFFVVDKNRRIVSATHEDLLGKSEIPEYESFIGRALRGETTVCPPFASIVAMKDETGKLRAGVPTMFVCAPVRDASFEVVAVLALRIRPEHEFTQILHMGCYSETGEMYAMNKAGVMVSNSRFDDSLILLGVLPDQPNAHSIVTVQVRDPLGDLTAGYRPKSRRSELPMTRPAAALIAGGSGSDMAGYRDYRGVLTVGAWKWLPKYDIGVISEVDVAEAFRPAIPGLIA